MHSADFCGHARLPVCWFACLFECLCACAVKEQLPLVRAGAPILVATPGRLNDFLEHLAQDEMCFVGSACRDGICFCRGLKLHCLPLCSPEADTENPDAVRNHWSLPLREFETKSIFERTSPTAEASRTLRGPGRFLSKVWATWFSTKRTGCWIWAPCLQLEHRSFQKPEEL